MKNKTKKSIIALFATVVLALPAFAAGEPENVTGLNAKPIDTKSIGLSWDSAKNTDGSLVDHYTIYYGTTSVQQAGEGEYDKKISTSNNATSYIVTSLEENTKYFFSITAVNSSNIESEAYGIETNATTLAKVEADTLSPSVTNINIIDSTHISIEFSEAVTLPSLLPEAAFNISEQITPSNMLKVLSAKLDTSDSTGATIILKTEEHVSGMNYIVTAGVAITDLAGNPIISGSTDSGLFIGSSVKAEEEKVTETTEVTEEETNKEVIPTTTTEKIDSICGNKIIETGETCDDGNTKSNDGCSKTCVKDKDTTPPENITNLVLSYAEQVESFMISMDWTASLNTAKDLVDQIIYQSEDRGNSYDKGLSLGKTKTHHELPNMEGGKEYTFKISTKDKAGNESVGVVKSIRLPSTGAGAGLMLLASLALTNRALKRKKK